MPKSLGRAYNKDLVLLSNLSGSPLGFMEMSGYYSDVPLIVVV